MLPSTIFNVNICVLLVDGKGSQHRLGSDGAHLAGVDTPGTVFTTFSKISTWPLVKISLSLNGPEVWARGFDQRKQSVGTTATLRKKLWRR